MKLTWAEVEQSLANLAKVTGGSSSMHRGIVTLANGERVFVKIGVDDQTKRWAKKEINTYRFLQRRAYPFIPKLLAHSPDETHFALELLDAAAGWSWADAWSEARLKKTLEAMDRLAALELDADDRVYFSNDILGQAHDGWLPLSESEQLRQILHAKLQILGRSDLVEGLDFAAEARRSAQFIFKSDSLIHNDVRADNCAWNAVQNTVKMVDWNWAQLGDRSIDLSALLVHVYKAGIDVTRDYRDRLNADALHWLAGFWFKSSVTPIWSGGPAELRDLQLQSALTALNLSKKIQK